MEELLKNAEDFFQSAEDNLKKGRFNPAVADFFKAIVILCDYIIYRDTKILPKNHNQRFSLLRDYFKDIYKNVSELFELYTKSYNFRLKAGDVIKIKNYYDELKKFIFNKK